MIRSQTRVVSSALAMAFLMAMALMTAIGFTQEQPTSQGRKSKNLKDVVNEVADLVAEHHLFPDVGRACADHIRSRMTAGAYNDIRDPVLLAKTLTADLNTVKKDAHLRVEFGPPRSIQDESLDPEEIRRRQYETYGRDNYGFVKFEVLDGTIGYLDLRVFAPVEIAGDTAVAVMNLLANCEAVIIDLRNNRGGTGDMVQLIASYFFSKRTHLTSYETRGEEHLTQAWTLVHVPGKRMPETPLFILTSKETASAAEEFAYDLKHHGRAAVIGETSAGGGHAAYVGLAADVFNVVIPTSRPIHPVTGTDWDGVGVKPDIDVPASQALSRARVEALEAVENRAGREAPSLKVKWAAETAEAEKNPVRVSESTLASYVGTYGPLVVTLKDGALWGRYGDGRTAVRMVPLSETRFYVEPEGESAAFDVRIEFVRDKGRKVVAARLERADIDQSVEFEREK